MENRFWKNVRKAKAIYQRMPDSYLVLRKKRSKILSRFGKIAPFGESLPRLARAVALQGKPLAEHSYSIYLDGKEIFDEIIAHYRLEKIEHVENDQIWIFRRGEREKALARISKIEKIQRSMKKNRHLSVVEHVTMGRLYGYSMADILAFIAWRFVWVGR